MFHCSFRKRNTKTKKAIRDCQGNGESSNLKRQLFTSVQNNKSQHIFHQNCQTNYVENAHRNRVVSIRGSDICLVNKNISYGGLRNVGHPSASKGLLNFEYC